MTPDKASLLRGYFESNYPSPRWVEELLEGLSGVSSAEVVLKLIREDPSQTMRHCTTLSVGLYFSNLGMNIQFLGTGPKRNFDIKVGESLAVEVKHLDDLSNWTILSRRVLRIPSSYLVNISTDLELSERQVGLIVSDIERALAGNSGASFEVNTPNADLSFRRVSSSGQTLPVVSSRIFGVDIPSLRRLFSSRIEDAKGQLRRSEVLKVAAVDINRTQFFADTIEDIFCGTPEWRFTKQDFRYIGEHRKPDGLLFQNDLWEGLDSLMIFYGYDRGARRIAYYHTPNRADAEFPQELGSPDVCS